jgi:hypothetical protein
MCWPINNMRGFLDKKPDLRVTLQRLMIQDIAKKLEQVVSNVDKSLRLRGPHPR